jgi:fermentation-respiration switch protein FrsA (DUF1100 family)
MMAPIAASQSSDIAFIVLMAGLGTDFADVIVFQRILELKNAGASETDQARHRSWYRRVFEIAGSDMNDDRAAKEIRALFGELSQEERAKLGKTADSVEGEISFCLAPWRRYAFQYDPKAMLMQVKCPLLAINGEKDMQVPAKENLAAIEAALRVGGNRRFMIRELEGLNHLFQTADTGNESEYVDIEETMSPDALKVIAGWIRTQVAQKEDESS